MLLKLFKYTSTIYLHTDCSLTCIVCKETQGPTFLLVEGGQDAVVPAHLEVYLLLHALRDGTLGDNDADACLNGAQDASVTVKDPSGGGHHCVPFILVVIVQRAGAEGRRHRSQHHQSKQCWQRINAQQRTQKQIPCEQTSPFLSFRSSGIILRELAAEN